MIEAFYNHLTVCNDDRSRAAAKAPFVSEILERLNSELIKDFTKESRQYYPPAELLYEGELLEYPFITQTAIERDALQQVLRHINEFDQKPRSSVVTYDPRVGSPGRTKVNTLFH